MTKHDHLDDKLVEYEQTIREQEEEIDTLRAKVSQLRERLELAGQWDEEW